MTSSAFKVRFKNGTIASSSAFCRTCSAFFMAMLRGPCASSGGEMLRCGSIAAPMSARLRITLDKGSEPITCEVAHIDLHFFHDVDAVILACEFSASNLPLAAVHEIMYRFGRAYPAGWTESGRPLHCPERVEWLDRSGNVLAASDYENRDRYLEFVGHHRSPCFAAHWEFLLRPLRAGEPEPNKSAELSADRVLPHARHELSDG